MAFCGNTFINGSTRQWVEQCIVRLKKESPGTPPGPPSLRLWMPDGAWQRMLTAVGKRTTGPDSTENAGPDPAAAFKALGVDALGKITMEWEMTPYGSELSLQVRLKDEPRGLWTILSRDPAPRGVYLGYVPVDVLSFQVGRLDIRAFWEEIPAMLEAFGPEASARFKMFLAYGAQMLQLDLGRDIVGNMDSVFTSYSRLEGIEDISLTAWQLRDAAAIEKALGKIFAEGSYIRTMMKDIVEILDLREYKVYSIKIPKAQPPVEGQEQPAKPPVTLIPYGVTVVEGDLVVGRLSLVRSFINGSRDKKAGRKFYKSPLYTFMDRRVPDNAMGYGFSDVNQMLKPGLEYLKKIGTDSEKPPTPAELPEGHPEIEKKPDPMDTFFQNLKYDRLPSPEFLSSFFGPWISYYQFDGKQFTVKWEIHKPQKKSKK